MNKKKLIFLIFIITIIAFSFAYIGLQHYRYHINEPMADFEYKKSILKDSRNLTYTLEALRPVMGPEELSRFIKENDNNPQIYKPNSENIQSGKYRANLHMHTTMSDGEPSVEYRMNYAQDYAQRKIKDGYMVIAITDHNTVLGAKEVIRVLKKILKNIKISKLLSEQKLTANITTVILLKDLLISTFYYGL